MGNADTPIPHTFTTGPSEPMCFADGCGTFAETHIAAPAEQVWALVSDINAPAAFSDEFLSARWVDDTPGVGAKFVGANKHPHIGEWEIDCYVHAYEVNRVFGWVTSSLDAPGAQWVFRLTPSDGGTLLRYELVLGPGPSGLTMAIEQRPEKEAKIIAFRLAEHHAPMQRTVDGFRDQLTS